jgi:hypothetical protein
MPKQSPLRLIKRWRRYERNDKESLKMIPKMIRGVYILFKECAGGIAGTKGTLNGKYYEVVYIGVAGIGTAGQSGIRGRLQKHAKSRKDWTHFSYFEVHDNVSADEILELESLLLVIFRHDDRIEIENRQKGSNRFYEVRKSAAWPEYRQKGSRKS